jgi:NAD(P)-dependent dehydrogenase (short-subunit alcohol dehydrogenase family)
MRFEAKVALVTGAASGIGLATAKRLGSEGTRVVIADIDDKKSSTAARAVKAAGAPDAWAVRCDVSQEAQVEAAVKGALERFGRLDVLVNNAGLMVFKPLEEHSEDDWLRVLRVDLLGAFFFTKQAFLTMKPGGAVVNVSSVHARETTPLVAAYAAAKAALLSLTRSAAIEGKPGASASTRFCPARWTPRCSGKSPTSSPARRCSSPPMSASPKTSPRP